MIEFHRLARSELRDAVQWYRDRSPKVAERFVDQIDHAVERIEHAPESHPVIGRNHRYVQVSRFPYLLVFRKTDAGAVLITAVAHTSQRSGYWRHRQ